MSPSLLILGFRSSSEFSEIVSPMSTWPSKLRQGSSEDLRKGLRRRLEGPRGLDGRTDVAKVMIVAVSGLGDE